MNDSDATLIGGDPQSITLQYELTSDELRSASFETVRRARKSNSRRMMQVILTAIVVYICILRGWRGALIGALLAIPIATDLSLYLTMRLISSFWETRWSADLRIADDGVRGAVTTQEGGPLTRRRRGIEHSWNELRSALCTKNVLILGFSGSMDVIIPARLLSATVDMPRIRTWLTAAGFRDVMRADYVGRCSG